MSDILLQLEDGPCLFAENAPCEADSRIVVSFADNADAHTRQAAKRLFDQLHTDLAEMARISQTPACGGRYGGTGHCHADTRPDSARDVNLLVVMEDPVADFEQARARDFLRNRGASILPVCEAQRCSIPSPGFPTNIMYRYPTGLPETAAPEVLYSARVGDDHLRVFISYRHADCAAIAAQVFHSLAEQRYAVFLDRFSGDPGQDFVGLIIAELFDKGLLLVLEAADTHLSPWVQTEIATALAHGIGIFKVNLPGSPDLLVADRVVDMRHAASTVDQHATLGETDIETIAADFQANRAVLGAARREHLVQQLEFAANVALGFGAKDKGSIYGLHILQTTGGTDLGLMASPRPPGAARFKKAQVAARQAGARPLIVGPLVQQLPEDGAVTEWLERVSRVATIDEGALIHELSKRI